jgi:hypothetical protein
MIWEVDDDCDKGVTWTEFQAMFSRCRNDKTGAPARTRLSLCVFVSEHGVPQATSRVGCTTWQSS